ncbi:helix-turn-helix domain-containing protein [Escherichia coli]|uniref:Helix-turn-helix transcriptional regulator n=1 Tax=Escherichia coli TaxID=562 RepID=A0AAI9BBN3_ECOLX|nr:helix-turn-helix transcriptional regulator [Escherichia coli]EFI6955471.1 helix-turn-helix transcriptional regulator [Escherichia coli]EFN1902149.1 helix-turn-helix transcriptional regulator [Escherichia coli]EKA1090858.1 helix-turn-helix transcriptional regulator [Escherichia coli]ELB9148366.1 helix-turn-helix transcriptional regulator [Escherichia coli]ELC3408881.1 helix-turn-helix transcriptional regulator [Escherichia coli]
MNNKKETCYIKAHIERHDITVHVWISASLTEAECSVLELLLKGYNITQISKSRFRSIKTVSFQKYKIYKKLGIHNDITFWVDISLSPYVRIKFSGKDSTFKKCILPCPNYISMQ